MSSAGHIEIYQGDDGQTRIEVRLQQDTLWLSQAQMAELFEKDVNTITEHLGNVFDEDELDPDGNYPEIPGSSSGGQAAGRQDIRALRSGRRHIRRGIG